MNISDVLDKNIISISLDAKNKMDALSAMTNILKNNNYIIDEEIFIQDILIRESEGVTGIGQGIAIPHGKSKTVNKVGIAIANLREPIEWETLDNKKVETIFLFCVSDDEQFSKNHMVLLSKVAGKLADDEILNAVKNSKDPIEIINVL